MARGQNPDKPFEKVLDEDLELPREEQSVFLLKPQGAEVYATARDGVMTQKHKSPARVKGRKGKRNNEEEETETETIINTGSYTNDVCCDGIVEIKNYIVPGYGPDGEDAPLVWDPKADKKEKLRVLGYMRPGHRDEVCNAITEGSALSEDETKNSESQSGSVQNPMPTATDAG